MRSMRMPLGLLYQVGGIRLMNWNCRAPEGVAAGSKEMEKELFEFGAGAGGVRVKLC